MSLNEQVNPIVGCDKLTPKDGMTKYTISFVETLVLTFPEHDVTGNHAIFRMLCS